MGSVAIQEDLSLEELVRLGVQAFDILPKKRKALYRRTDGETFHAFDSEQKLVDRYGDKVWFVMRRLRVHRNTPSHGIFSKESITYMVLRYCGTCELYARKTLANPEYRKILGLKELA
ncbi:MAG: hypothetical protein V4681_02175 [Patescibacteria group bacterium]